jgi:putative hydrolase of the HAD superfamily
MGRMGQPGIRAVFFDFGGVVACIDHLQVRLLEDEYGIPEGGIWQAMYETPEWHALRIGHGNERDWVAAIDRTLDGLAGKPVASEIGRRWVQCWRGLDQEIMALIERLRGRYRIGMISNATLTLEDELRTHHRIYDRFEVIVNSARVGVAKPDRRIFEHAAGLLALEPAACLHIDDLPHNVDGARQAGFQALQYDGDFASLAEGLRTLGIEA